ncbi:hypothetical protein C8Q78DRAFT_343441 [Trametes maxima]|nr:hypothetical protein C8Q78DRAFT_343441 [Trametes maxima]
MATSPYQRTKHDETITPSCDSTNITFPVEILDEIVACLLLALGHTFRSVAAFTLASHQFRQIALRRYYAVLRIHSFTHWIRTCRIKGISTWVRSLEGSTTFFRYKMGGLSQLKSLINLELDFSGDGLATQGSRAMLLFKNMAADLIYIKLTNLPRIDTALLSLVASRFPTLRTLELSCTERLDEKCCWLCFEESSTCCIHSPIPDSYPTAEALTTSFCNALASLKNLEYLHLGIFLSDADVLVHHFQRCASSVFESPRTGLQHLLPPFGPNKCAVCYSQHAEATRGRDRIVEALFKASLPSLISVGFSSWFPAIRSE